MFHNYFYLKRLAGALHKKLKDSELVECFSQNKDELVFAFQGSEDFFIKAALLPEICLLQFPDDFRKANKNYVDLFEELIGLKVEEVGVFPSERSFRISFENFYEVIFKMHSSRSNVLIANKGQIKYIFKNQLKNDLDLIPEKDLARTVVPDELRFFEVGGDLRSFHPALGKEVKEYLEQRLYTKQSIEDKWSMMSEVLKQLEENPMRVVKDQQYRLTLLDTDHEIVFETSDPILAANELFHRFTFQHYLNHEKSAVLRTLEKEVTKAKNYIQKSENKLEEVKNRRSYEEVANLLMSNLHTIAPRSKKVTLQDFYEGGNIDIKLNPNLTAQKNAESYYRKGKSQKKEVQILEQNIANKKSQLESLLKEKEHIEDTEDLKLLRKRKKSTSVIQNEQPLPFNRFSFMDYDILIGKSGKHNDELTLKFAKRDDLWLHAKDVPGSHVVVKVHPGHSTPNPVLERAAELAAWNSKRKTDSLCPVIYTPKKFVRKRKGDPPGAVVVEREEIIMVEPRGLD